jgi:hypothetical protein
VGSAPQASETVFREDRDDIVCGVSKGDRAPAMSDGTETRRALGLKSAVRQGAGFTPYAVPTRRKKEEGSNRRTQLTEVDPEKKDGRRVQDYSTASPDIAELETTSNFVSGTRRGVLHMRSDAVNLRFYVHWFISEHEPPVGLPSRNSRPIKAFGRNIPNISPLLRSQVLLDESVELPVVSASMSARSAEINSCGSRRVALEPEIARLLFLDRCGLEIVQAPNKRDGNPALIN